MGYLRKGRRQTQFQCLLFPEEKLVLDKVAKAAGLPQSLLVRQLVRNAHRNLLAKEAREKRLRRNR